MGQWHTSELLALQRPREEDVKFEVSPENIVRHTLSQGTGREGERKKWAGNGLILLVLDCNIDINIKMQSRARNVAQLVIGLASMHEILDSVPTAR